jgi:glutamate-1-semialdehyde 2,1-aminomutase
LDLLEDDPAVLERIDRCAEALAEGMRGELRERQLPYTVSRLAGMVDLKFLPRAPRDYDEASRAERGLFARYYHAMRARGVLLAPSSNELMFLSSEHGAREIERTLTAFGASLDLVTDERRSGADGIGAFRSGADGIGAFRSGADGIGAFKGDHG